MNQFGPALVSAVILGIYALHVAGHGIAMDAAELKLLETCLTLVVGYWLGSSVGSARKTEISEGKV